MQSTDENAKRDNLADVRSEAAAIAKGFESHAPENLGAAIETLAKGIVRIVDAINQKGDRP